MIPNVTQAFGLAAQHHQAGRLAEAEVLYRQILAVEPNHAEAWHMLGLLAHQAGRHDLGVEWIRRSLALNPNDAGAYSNLGVVLAEQGQFDEAIASYRQAIALKPEYAEAHTNLGNTLRKQGRLDDAIAAHRRAVALRPDQPNLHNNLGVALTEHGRLEEAISAYQRAIALNPAHANAQSNLGNALRKLGRRTEAITAYRRAIELKPDHAEAYTNLGSVLAEQEDQLDEAAAVCRRAIELSPKLPAAHTNLGNALKHRGQLDDAIAAYRRALELQPDQAEAHNNLGNALRERGQIDEAIAACRRALELDPKLPEAHNNLGIALREQGQFHEAIAACRQALALRPDYAEARNNLGVALAATGRLGEAVSAFHQALEFNRNFPEVHNNLGNAFVETGQFDDAMAAYRRALELRPGYADARANLAGLLQERGRAGEALAECRRALELNPDLAEAQNKLGNALKDCGQLDEALAAFRRAFELDPQHRCARSNLLFTLHFHPGHDSRSIAEEQHRWNQQVCRPLGASIPPHTNDRNPERRLRIGYVSPDFRFHAVTFFFAPLLEAHDHEQFEVYAYASVTRPDFITDRLRQGADVWREVRYLSDAELAEQIRHDGIDILVDLAMHTSGNRLLALARRPAPVQVSWLGYPGNTGMEAIGYRLSDARIDPDEPEETDSGEQVMRLPDAWCCYEPITEFPQVRALPAADGRGVTFGSLNQFAKINETLLGCWAALLRALPEARLLIICPAGETQERTLRHFAERGVSPERVELLAPCSWTEYTRLGERIDVALDTYPCNGMTTTCHALWMGLPVITRAGESAVSRASLSLLHVLGLQEWVATSDEEYVRIAVNLAGDLARLGDLRATLRAKMAASPLMDAPRFARNVEDAYRAMWRQWCRSWQARDLSL